MDTKRANREDISLRELQHIVYSKTDDILEISETVMWDGCIKMLKSLSTELSTTLKRVENDNRMDKSMCLLLGVRWTLNCRHICIIVATGIPPWVQRASDMKAEVVINHDLERKLQQHNDEIYKLVKDIKLKVR